MEAPSPRRLRPLPDVDWDDWRQTLQHYAAATGLAVSAFADGGMRRVGPLHSSRIAGVLDAAFLWAEGGAALALERELASKVAASGRVEHAALCGELQFQAMPIKTGGRVRGVVVHGWVFHTFTTSLACQRIAQALGIDGARLWAEARLEPPVPAARMAMYAQLLQTLIASTDRHADAIDRLEELGHLREVFLAGVSHELRTPLSALDLRIEVLLRGGLKDPAALRAALLKMKQHVAVESRLVEDLIDAARTRTGQLSLERSRVALGSVLQLSIASVLPQAQAKRVRLTAPAVSDLGDVHVDGDAQRLQQVFSNLLSNAVKFTPPEGSVDVTGSVGDETMEVVFTDTGEGIDPAMLPTIFDAFTKQQQGNAQGLGLGLSIARHIVELHGGTVRVESPGRGLGAIFRVLLPRRLL